MEIYLLRHGQAVSEQEDPARPLSREGVEQIQASASAIRRLGLVFDVNEDGSLVASSMDPDDIVNSRGDILIGGEPIGIERTVGDEPVPTAPPVIQARNGVGTRNVATAHTAKPGRPAVAPSLTSSVPTEPWSPYPL